MPLPVVAPMRSKGLFEKWQGIEVAPIFYRLRKEPLAHKIRRKLNLIDAAFALGQRLEFATEKEEIGGVRAMWLSSDFYLPTVQMDRLLDRLPKLKWVYSQVTGTEHLNPESFRQREVMVSNTGNMSSRRVAEMALACVFSHAKRLPEHSAMQRMRRWKSLVCGDINRQTVGVVGTGNIGNELARLCAAVGMRVIGASRDPGRVRAQCQAYSEVIALDTQLDSLLRESDHVVVTLPLNEQTRGLIGREALSRMKPDASVINVSRGAVVDEHALCKALSDRMIGAAYIDVPAKVPPHAWSTLYRTPHLVLTHYSSANSAYVLEDAFQQFMTGVAKLAQGDEPANRVL